MNSLAYSFLAISFTLDTIASVLNLRTLTPEVPAEVSREFTGLIDDEKYKRSQAYIRERAGLTMLSRSISFVVTMTFLIAGGLSWLDQFARNQTDDWLYQGLIFLGTLAVARGLVQLPFSIYSTFSIEAKYGFNRTTPKVFVGDLLKALLLGSVLGGGAACAVLAFFHHAGDLAWFYAWAALTAFQLVVAYLAPAVIMPLFNRFEPLADGELSQAIRRYADGLGFKISGIFRMDGSKRSTHGNAFFTGFGRFRRLVLFDTLIEKHSIEELVAVFAHEVGHFRLRHIVRGMLLSLVLSFAAFFGLGWVLRSPWIFASFEIAPSAQAALVIGTLLFIPADKLVSIFTQWLSRKHEFEADRFSSTTYGKPEALVSALKKLSADNLAHLTPHPFKVALDYTHPPVLMRVRALRHQS